MSRGLLIALAALIATFVFHFDVVDVNRDSMADTYCDGDLLLGSRPSSQESLRGRVVVIDHPYYGKLLKRVVAEGGDEVFIKNGMTVVNDKELAEPYVGCRERLQAFESEWSKGGLTRQGGSVVGADEVYLLGDNRLASLDSRVFGAVRRSMVKAVISSTLYRHNVASCRC